MAQTFPELSQNKNGVKPAIFSLAIAALMSVGHSDIGLDSGRLRPQQGSNLQGVWSIELLKYSRCCARGRALSAFLRKRELPLYSPGRLC
jgi:hypothetical protein